MGARPTLTGALVAPLFLLVACGDTTSVADPPVSPSTATSSPTQEPKRETPEHFIRRFYAAEKAMENSGRTKMYANLLDGCRPCNSLVNQVDAIYEAGGFIRWGGLTIRSILRAGGTGDIETFSVRFIARPTHYRETSSSPIKSLSGGLSTDLLSLTSARGEWAVTARARTSS